MLATLLEIGEGNSQFRFTDHRTGIQPAGEEEYLGMGSAMVVDQIQQQVSTPDRRLVIRLGLANTDANDALLTDRGPVRCRVRMAVRDGAGAWSVLAAPVFRGRLSTARVSRGVASFELETLLGDALLQNEVTWSNDEQRRRTGGERQVLQIPAAASIMRWDGQFTRTDSGYIIGVSDFDIVARNTPAAAVAQGYGQPGFRFSKLLVRGEPGNIGPAGALAIEWSTHADGIDTPLFDFAEAEMRVSLIPDTPTPSPINFVLGPHASDLVRPGFVRWHYHLTDSARRALFNWLRVLSRQSSQHFNMEYRGVARQRINTQSDRGMEYLSALSRQGIETAWPT